MTEFIRDYGWIAAIIPGAAIWIAAIWTVFSKGKFVRNQWLWALLTLVTFSLPIPISHNRWLSLYVPLGAITVLLYAAFGPRPVRRSPLNPDS